MFLEYPKWLYQPDNAVLVNDETEEAALEGDWFAAPFDPAEAVEKQPAPKRGRPRKEA